MCVCTYTHIYIQMYIFNDHPVEYISRNNKGTLLNLNFKEKYKSKRNTFLHGGYNRSIKFLPVCE